MMHNKKISIGFAGLTHLGIISLVAAADKGFNIIAFDQNKNLIKDLKKNILKISEPDLKKYLKKNIDKIYFTSDVKELEKSNFIYLSEDVKTNSSGVSNLLELDSLLEYLSIKIDRNIPLIILSQVPPGYTRIKKSLFVNIFYQVETLIFGNAMKRALSPERIIFGKPTDTAKMNSDVLFYLKSFNCQILEMNYESAELCKISINLFLVSSITTTNFLASVSEKINADWYKIIPALQMDKRIGEFAYLYPGLGISGGNLQRDLVTIIDISKKNKINCELINQFIDNSKKNKLWLIKKLRLITSKTTKKFKISILGVSYKENTNSIKNSPAISLIHKNKQFVFNVYDPIIDLSKIKLDNCIIADNITECIKGAEIIIIMNNSKEFKYLNNNNIYEISNVKYIIDPLNVLNKVNLKKITKKSIGS